MNTSKLFKLANVIYTKKLASQKGGLLKSTARCGCTVRTVLGPALTSNRNLLSAY